MNRYTILYRGPLSSCNYGCGYCPFAKRQESKAVLQRDQSALQRFTSWTAAQDCRFKVMFTPWGEALVRRWYRSAMRDLSHQSNIDRVIAQTNLSWPQDWIEDCNGDRLSFWATFHPTEVTLSGFLDRVRRLHQRGVSLSVGAVGIPEHREVIASLRAELPSDIPMWINAQRPRRFPYSEEDLRVFSTIDPQFQLTTRRHRSLGMQCEAGEKSFTVDGRGIIRRCHFVEEPLTTLDCADWQEALKPRTCPNAVCDCYLGFNQLTSLQLQDVYGDQRFERIPLPTPVC